MVFVVRNVCNYCVHVVSICARNMFDRGNLTADNAHTVKLSETLLGQYGRDVADGLLFKKNAALCRSLPVKGLTVVIGILIIIYAS